MLLKCSPPGTLPPSPSLSRWVLVSTSLRQVGLDVFLNPHATLSITTAQDPAYLVVYMFWMKLILVEMGPYIAIAALNIAVIFL